jgi:hypothetical protein
MAIYARFMRRPRPHALGNFRPLLSLNHANVVLPLQIQPELRTVTKVTAEPYGGIGRDRAPKVEDIGDTARGNADIETAGWR